MRGKGKRMVAWLMALCMLVCMASSLAATDIFAAEGGNLNHYMLAESSSNVNLWVTTGAGGSLQALSAGEAFTTSNSAAYFYVVPVNGYTSASTFRHVYVKNEPDREVFPDNWSNQTSIYETFDSSKSSYPGYTEASQLNCSYVFKYTGTTGSAGNFWAQFEITAEPIEISVVYDANGGEDAPEDNGIYYHKNVTEQTNDTISIPEEEPVCDGRKFQYWVGSDNGIYRPGDTIEISDSTIWNSLTVNGTAATFTLTACWEEESYRIKYHGNNNTGGKNVIDNTLYKYGDSATVAKCTFEKLNYDFLGWSTEEGSKTVSYLPDDTISMTKQLDLYAVWGVKGNVTITYKASDGGTVTVDTETFDPKTESPQGSTASADRNYNFLGWKMASETTQNYASQSEIFVPAEPADGWPKTITYIALFDKKAHVTIETIGDTVIYDGRVHTSGGFTVNGEKGSTFTIEGKTYTITGIAADAVSLTDAGSIKVALSGKWKITDPSGKDVTANFKVDTIENDLTVQPRPIKLISDSANKGYDGSPLTAKNVTAVYHSSDETQSGAEAFVGTDGVEWTVTGSQTSVGTSKNTFTYAFKEGTNRENYSITEVEGDLSVTQAVENQVPSGDGDTTPDGDGGNNTPDDNNAGDGNTDNGNTDDGNTDNGSTDNGSTDNGNTDDGDTDDGNTDDSTDNGNTDADGGNNNTGNNGGTNNTGNNGGTNNTGNNGGTNNTGNNGGTNNTGNNNTGNNGGNNNIGNNIGNNLTTVTDDDIPRGIIEIDDDGNTENTTIEDEEVPLAAADESPAKWALVNLIAAILTVLLCLALLVTWFTGKKRDEEEEEDENEQKIRRRTALRMGSILPAAGSVLIFIITENWRNPMTLFDRWTLLMILILGLEVLLALFSAKKTDDDEDRDDEGVVVLE